MLIVSDEKAFVLMADTPAEKNGWVQAIRLCMRDLWLEAEALEKVGRASTDRRLRARSDGKSNGP